MDPTILTILLCGFAEDIPPMESPNYFQFHDEPPGSAKN